MELITHKLVFYYDRYLFLSWKQATINHEKMQKTYSLLQPLFPVEYDQPADLITVCITGQTCYSLAPAGSLFMQPIDFGPTAVNISKLVEKG